MAKKIYLIFTFLGILNCAYSQYFKGSDCFRDSILQSEIGKYLQKTRFDTIDSYNLLKLIPTQKNNSHCFCDLIFFVKIFNDALEDEFDVKFDVNNNPSPFSYDLNDELATLYESINMQHRIYGNLIIIQKSYIQNVMQKYKGKDVDSLEKDINNIIYAGFYKKPMILKDILLLKYKFNYINNTDWKH
jgi:hypothetical protein